MDVDIDALIVLGDLTTERIEKEINGNLLVLDKIITWISRTLNLNMK